MPEICETTHSPNSLKIYEVAKSCYGKDISIDQSIPNNVQCSAAVSFILNKVPCGFPASGFADTFELDAWLAQSQDFKEVPFAEADYGDVIVSPRNGPVHGHCGIIAKYGILSNDSATGLFLEFFSEASWKEYFGMLRGLEIHIYRAV